MRSLHPCIIFPENLEPPVSRSLAIQFILQELLASFDLLQHLKTITPIQLQGANLAQEITFISNEVEKFFLFSLKNPFNQKGGGLDKLCFYCEILVQASNIDHPDIPLILEEMRNSVLRIKSKLLAWKKMPALHPLDLIIPYLLDIFTDLHEKLCRFFTALIPFLQEARSNENVLIYLLEQKERLNSYVEPYAIEKLLHSFFPMGPSQMRAVICEGYSRRGFGAFFLNAEPMIEAFEAEVACQALLNKL